MNKIIIICGPTCVGKTRVAIELAKRTKGEIISADSQQIYKGLDIGTAKPSESERKEVKHHLIDIISPDTQFNVAKYVELADESINSINKKKRIPFVVGGTGLYIKALCNGLAEGPGRDDEYRNELNELKIANGTECLYDMLIKSDPMVALKLKKNDTTRIIRALEVLHVTGKSISEFQNEHKFKEKRYEYLKIGLNIDRKELYKRIDERVEKMIRDGLVDEVRGLLRNYDPTCQSFKAVGYKEIVRFITEDGSYNNVPEVTEDIKLNTRHYAKRQLTWFKADKEIKWFDPSDLETIFDSVDSF